MSTSLISDADIGYKRRMRTIVDIHDAQIRDLAALAERVRQPRAVLVREAIDDYLARHRSDTHTEAFGLWGSDGLDGLAYQEKARAEW
jgi:predicted transcriptional regulator